MTTQLTQNAPLHKTSSMTAGAREYLQCLRDGFIPVYDPNMPDYVFIGNRGYARAVTTFLNYHGYIDDSGKLTNKGARYVGGNSKHKVFVPV